jgi:hypothetical protein
MPLPRRFSARSGRKAARPSAFSALHMGKGIASMTYAVRLGTDHPPVSLEIRLVEMNKCEFGLLHKLEQALPLGRSTRAGGSMGCEHCQRLSEEHRKSVDHWREMLRKLSDAALSHEADLFKKIWDQAALIQKECEAARKAFAEHLATH